MAYRKNDKIAVIKGKLTFEKPVVIENLSVQAIDDVPVENFYCFNGTNVVPPISIGHMHIENSLHVDTINGHNFDDFMEKRLVKKGRPNQVLTGHPTFSNIRVVKNFNVRSINNIDIEDIVFKNSKKLQEIRGEKKIAGNLTIIGPTVFDSVNGVDIL